MSFPPVHCSSLLIPQRRSPTRHPIKPKPDTLDETSVHSGPSCEAPTTCDCLTTTVPSTRLLEKRSVYQGAGVRDYIKGSHKRY